MIGEVVSKYRILDKLGEGGMGEVYLAEDTELNRKAALKFLPDELASNAEALARFKREAQTAAGLNHPNIVTVYEVGQHKGRPYIAMAYVDGEPLSDLIAQRRLTVERAIDIALQILDGLGNAHGAGIVHRDIKPGNIFIDREGRVKILDFGLAKPGGASKLTGELSTMGTIFYMSPEQTRGDEIDQRSDLFSLGAVLYEMLAGRPPFEGKHIAAVVYSITNEEPKPLSQLYQRIPTAMELVVAKALAKNPEERYQSAGEMAGDLERIQAGVRPLASRPGKKLLKFLVPTTAAVFLAVVLLLILKPFRFQVTSDHPAVAAENSLAIMYFENVVDPQDPRRLGEIATDLLITDLSESDYIQVVSSQRLYDILKLQGKEGVKVIDKDTASDVAKAARAKWMLMGSILQEQPNLIITSRLVDVETGQVTASQRINGGAGEQIFDLVDRLTQEVKNDLALPALAHAERDSRVADVTTHSTDAYRYYLEGMENLNKFYTAEARAAFKKALGYDSTFAMVHLRLAASLATSRAERKSAIEKAVQYSDNVTKKERHYIESAAALFTGDVDKAIVELGAIIKEYPNEKTAYSALGDIYRTQRLDLPKAIENYRKAIEIDPQDKMSYNLLAYCYQSVGDVDNYIWAIYQYMALAPDEANPYDSRGDLYAYSGKADKAIQSYREALRRKPDFYPSLFKLGCLNLFTRDYAAAESCFAQLRASSEAETRAEGRMCQILVPLYQGKLNEALDVAGRAIAEDVAEGYRGAQLFLKGWCVANIHADKGDLDLAIKETEELAARFRKENPDQPWTATFLLVGMYARKGDTARTKALLGQLKDEIERGGDKTLTADYSLAKGWVDIAEGNFDAACKDLEDADPLGERFLPGFFHALVLLKAGRAVESVNAFEKLLRRYSEDRASYPVQSVRVYYYLGLAQEELGRTQEAIKNYEEFLTIWKDADPGIEGLADAKSRLARLRQPG
jgi:serine/threonine protein kinase/predicted Zn-dependent protease